MQESFQNLTLLPFKMAHRTPLRVSYHTLPITFHKWDLFVGLRLGGIRLGSIIYFLHKSLTHKESVLAISPQQSFIKKAELISSNRLMPNPPLSFGWQTSLHFTKLIYFSFALPPHKKFQQSCSIWSRVARRIQVLCVVYNGIAARTDWTRVRWPARDNDLAYHEPSLARTLFVSDWYVFFVTLPWRRGTPR